MDNAVNSKNPTSKVCQVCGVAGYSKLLVTCCRCARASQHIYCMPVVHLQIPDSWLCEECLVGTPVAPNGKHHNPYDGHKSVKLCLPSADGEEQGHRTLSSLCPSDAAMKNVNTVNDGKGPSSCYVGPNVHSFDAPHPDTGDVSRKKGLTFSDVQSKGCNLHEMSISRKFLINTVENALNSCLALGACWKGTFEVSGVFSQTNIEMQAYYPGEMIAKSYDILKNIPTILNLKIVPRMDAWPKLFQLVTPSFEDVGLIFMPAECERSKEKYTCLLTWIDKHDSAIQSSIGNVELLIYSSTRLTENSQRIDKQTYLWGVLKHTKKRKHHMHNLEKPSQVATGIKDNNYPAQFSDAFEARNEVDMEVDMIGGVEVGRIDIPLPNPDGPPGFQRQIRSDAGHEYIP